jgi:hypothetical protein
MRNELTGENCNMLVENNYKFNIEPFVLYKFKIFCRVYPYIDDLQDSWNFVSLPFNKSITKNEIIIIYKNSCYNWSDSTTGSDPILLPFIYDYNRTSQSYESVQTLMPGRGYWIYTNYGCQLCTSDLGIVQSDDYITDMEISWNALGVPADETINKTDLIIWYNGSEYNWTEATTGVNPMLVSYIFGYNRATQLCEESDILKPGHCYWMYAYKKCSLKRRV